jgi:hypothetical protein
MTSPMSAPASPANPAARNVSNLNASSLKMNSTAFALSATAGLCPTHPLIVALMLD